MWEPFVKPMLEGVRHLSFGQSALFKDEPLGLGFRVSGFRGFGASGIWGFRGFRGLGGVGPNLLSAQALQGSVA